AATYLWARKQYGVNVLVKALRKGKPYTHSVIITKADTDIKSLDELKGRTFAFGDRQAATSYVVPRAMLKDAGVDINDLRYYHFLGHNDAVATAVVKGDYDAGGVRESTAFSFQDQGIRFLKFSDEVPEFNICCHPSLDEGTLSLIKTALISLNDASAEGAAILKSIDEGYTGFVEADDNDYDGVRQQMSKLEIL
ncbi:MAG TPA: PhnD/SsuA/transferrin family substrate-binding protein, partial [Thermodesulfovibrionales bacterium]|nr:PhnD/SsuA/transferrin family substrate-binding protein [Thermodesulfovibrionales bacterium]